MEKIERFRGSILGLAVGDALGTTIEFKIPGTFKPMEDIIGGGPFDLVAGQWTDDTSMALCLAQSIVHTKGFSSVDQMNKYVQWYRKGYLSSTGTCFDIGITTRRSLNKYEKTKEANDCGLWEDEYSGNGSLMRLAPIPLYYHKNISEATVLSGASSSLTHASIKCVDACKLFGYLIAKCFTNVSKEELLNIDEGLIYRSDDIKAVANGSYKHKTPPEIKGSGYVVQSLEAALWAFWNSSSFEEGVLKAVNLGDDADTTGAIFGQLAGCFYGESSIPEKWRKILAKSDMITQIINDLYSAHLTN